MRSYSFAADAVEEDMKVRRAPSSEALFVAVHYFELRRLLVRELRGLLGQR